MINELLDSKIKQPFCKRSVVIFGYFAFTENLQSDHISKANCQNH